MAGPSPQPSPPVPEPWRPRFSLGTLLLAMLVISVAAAAFSYLVRASQVGSPRSFQLTFIVFTLAAPSLLLVVVTVLWQLYRWFERPRRK